MDHVGVYVVLCSCMCKVLHIHTIIPHIGTMVGRIPDTTLIYQIKQHRNSLFILHPMDEENIHSFSYDNEDYLS